MTHAPQAAAILVLAYLLGSIPFGLLIARSQGVDIRAQGSGNIGATNVWRVMGRKWGLTTFLLDLGKGLLAVVLARWIATHWPATVALPHGHTRLEYFEPAMAGIIAALGCILGHSFPVWLRFKGGKGVATSLGVIIGMMPLASLIIFAVWALVFWTTKYVSLASIVASLSLPVVVVGLMVFAPGYGWSTFYFAVAAALLVILRHRSNIQRLMRGTELRFGTPKTAAEPATTEPETPPSTPTA